MRRTTNFAFPVRRAIFVVFLASIIMSFTGLFGIYYLGRNRSILLEESASLRQDITTLESKASSSRSSDTFSYTQSDVVNAQSRIERINSASPIRGSSVNRLLSTIESMLPEGVILHRLRYSSINGELHIVAETTDADKIYLFLERLEQSQKFSSPELQQRPGSEFRTDSATKYEIHAKAQQLW